MNSVNEYLEGIPKTAGDCVLDNLDDVIQLRAAGISKSKIAQYLTKKTGKNILPSNIRRVLAPVDSHSELEVAFREIESAKQRATAKVYLLSIAGRPIPDQVASAATKNTQHAESSMKDILSPRRADAVAQVSVTSSSKTVEAGNSDNEKPSAAKQEPAAATETPAQTASQQETGIDTMTKLEAIKKSGGTFQKELGAQRLFK